MDYNMAPASNSDCGLLGQMIKYLLTSQVFPSSLRIVQSLISATHFVLWSTKTTLVTDLDLSPGTGSQPVSFINISVFLETQREETSKGSCPNENFGKFGSQVLKIPYTGDHTHKLTQ